MTLKDILAEYGKDVIINWRVTSPPEINNPNGEFFGYCKWENGNLIPLDGDSYFLDAEILKWNTYKINGKEYLEVLEETEWV